MIDLIIKNGNIVTEEETFVGDIAIKDEKIIGIGKVEEESANEIDATGQYVLPGAIDVHAHIEHVAGTSISCDDFASATYAAAMGGTTSVLAFANQKKGRPALECIEEKMKSAKEKSCIDFGFHITLTDVNEQTIKEIEAITKMGILSIKVFMAFKGAGFMVSDAYLLELLEESKKYGALVGVHAENEDICVTATNKLIKAGMTTLDNYYKSRPRIAETEATERAIVFAESVDAPLYIFHLTNQYAYQKIVQARKRGVKVYAETCPHYLTLDQTKFEEENGYLYLMSPPLREKEDQEALWEGLNSGIVQIVSTDHCPYTVEQKAEGNTDFSKIAPGIPGIETLLPVIYSEAVAKGRLSMNTLVKMISGNPAEIFKLKNKGKLAVGYDADIVLLDPNQEVFIDKTAIHMASGYSPFEGMTLKGKITQTILRGKTIQKNGEFFGEKGSGQFIERIAD